MCGLFCYVELDGCKHEYNYTTLHPTWGSPNNVCLVANAWYNCCTRSDMRSEFGVSPRERPSGKKRQILYHFGPAGKTRGSREEWPSGRQLYVCKNTDPRARSAGPTRGSPENNSRVIVTGPASYPYLTGYDPCLLYTSPSPRDLSTSRMPSSA